MEAIALFCLHSLSWELSNFRMFLLWRHCVHFIDVTSSIIMLLCGQVKSLK